MGYISNNCVTRSFHRTVDLANEAIAKNENLDKVAKIITKTVDFVSLLTGKVSSAFKAFASSLKQTTEVIELFGFVGRVKELVCPDKNGAYFLKKSTWQKCADRVFLTAASIFKTINMAAKFTLINLGKAAKFAIGKVPVLKLIPDTLVMFSSFFSIWDNKNVHQQKDQKAAFASSKIEKWTSRTSVVANVRAGHAETLSGLKKDYETKSAALENEIRGLDTAKIKEISKKTATLNKYKERLGLIAENKYEELAGDLEKPDIAFKQRYWTVEHANQKYGKNNAMLGMISGASKIFVITMATTGTAFGLATTPWALSLLAVGIAIDSFGLSKSLYEHVAGVKELPKRSVAV